LDLAISLKKNGGDIFNRFMVCYIKAGNKGYCKIVKCDNGGDYIRSIDKREYYNTSFSINEINQKEDFTKEEMEIIGKEYNNINKKDVNEMTEKK